MYFILPLLQCFVKDLITIIITLKQYLNVYAAHLCFELQLTIHKLKYSHYQQLSLRETNNKQNLILGLQKKAEINFV